MLLIIQCPASILSSEHFIIPPSDGNAYDPKVTYPGIKIKISIPKPKKSSIITIDAISKAYGIVLFF